MIDNLKKGDSVIVGGLIGKISKVMSEDFGNTLVLEGTDADGSDALSGFLLDDEIGSGLPLWLPNGTIIIDELEKLAK